MKQEDIRDSLSAFISKMKKEGLPPIVVDTFAYYYKKVVSGETGILCDSEIAPVMPDEIADFDHIRDYAESGRRMMKHAVRITLNGGLGTSMGLISPKSLLEVRNGKSFLEIILNQSERSKVKLALMNSFSTHEETLSAISKINPPEFPMTFLQHKFPKILRKNFSPPVCPLNPELEWNPPGHGDIYTALFTSGMIDRLSDAGIRYAFISNSDNLGASVDASLLGWFAENKLPFMMEVAERTPADAKGGHLARYKAEGRLMLRESAQCHEAEKDAFRDISRYRFFNTNNLWINLKFLKELIAEQKTVRLPMILNPKNIDPRDKESPRVFQIETAMGAAISLFEGAAAIRVPRSRFFPVKKCSDLLLVRSDYFLFSEDRLLLNPDRRSDRVKINLDPNYYGKIDDFDERFSEGVPSLTECESLLIEGDVRFERGVKLKGNVVIKNPVKSQMLIKAGTVISG
jgi:UTP--glucose-1-phosphate uridylyltransferase